MRKHFLFMNKSNRMKAIKLILVILTLIGSKNTVFAQSLRDTLTRDLIEFAKAKDFVGFAVGIVNEDSLIYSKGFGYADKKTKRLYTINTLQPIASISKTLIGVSLMKAQEMGKLDLDDDINKYLPFPIINPYYPNETITIRQLANHTSTLKEPKYLHAYIFKEDLPLLHENLENKKLKRQARSDVKERNKKSTKEIDRISIIEFTKERFHPSGKYYKKKNFVKATPGTEYYYSNEGAALAAYIVEQATGTNFIEFTEEHILQPLKMENSSWDHKSLMEVEGVNRSKLYYFGQEIPRFEDITYPDGELVTSVSDFSKYMIAMINGYNGKDNILSSESYKEMMTKAGASSEEAILWEVDTKYSGYIGYSGADMGILTLGHFFKEEKMGVIIFSNTSHLEGINQDFISLFFMLKKYCEKLDSLKMDALKVD